MHSTLKNSNSPKFAKKTFYSFIDSPWRTLISQAVLRLQEEGKLRELKERWWVEKNEGAGDCGGDTGGGGDAPELGMDNVGGVFLVLGAGLIVSILVGIIDFLWNIRQIAIDEKVNLILVHSIIHIRFASICLYFHR